MHAHENRCGWQASHIKCMTIAANGKPAILYWTCHAEHSADPLVVTMPMLTFCLQYNIMRSTKYLSTVAWTNIGSQDKLQSDMCIYMYKYLCCQLTTLYIYVLHRFTITMRCATCHMVHMATGAVQVHLGCIWQLQTIIPVCDS